ncbi:MAG: hypothetical protein ACP5G6_05515 [Conexivisphaera sp.]
MATLTPELYDVIVRIVDDKVKDIKVTREEFDKLSAVVGQLAERVDQLAEAQRRTEERLNQLAERVDQLAEAQRRTEERLNQLAERVDKLAERMDQLAEAQRRTEERLDRLTDRVDKLAEAVGVLNKSVSSLGETIGFGLEDIARVVLPGWLHRHLGVEMGELERRFLRIGGREYEVNLYGEGSIGGRRVVIIAEAKSRIHASDVERFNELLSGARESMDGAKVIGVVFGYVIYPDAKERAQKLGIHAVASYER